MWIERKSYNLGGGINGYYTCRELYKKDDRSERWGERCQDVSNKRMLKLWIKISIDKKRSPIVNLDMKQVPCASFR